MAGIGSILRWWPQSKPAVIDANVSAADKAVRLGYELGRLQVRYEQRCERNGKLREEMFRLRRESESSRALAALLAQLRAHPGFNDLLWILGGQKPETDVAGAMVLLLQLLRGRP